MPDPKPIACPRCAAELTDAELKSLVGRYHGSKPRPAAKGRKRPGVGGRPRSPKKEGTR